MARLTAKQRGALPAAAFALSGRRYPINDAGHARNALARVAQNGTPQEKKKVRGKVKQRFPGIGPTGAARDKAIAQFVKRKPSEISDVRSSNPGTRGVEGAPRYPSKAGYQIPYSQDTGRNPYRRGRR